MGGAVKSGCKWCRNREDRNRSIFATNLLDSICGKMGKSFKAVNSKRKMWPLSSSDPWSFCPLTLPRGGGCFLDLCCLDHCDVPAFKPIWQRRNRCSKDIVLVFWTSAHKKVQTYSTCKAHKQMLLCLLAANHLPLCDQDYFNKVLHVTF